MEYKLYTIKALTEQGDFSWQMKGSSTNSNPAADMRKAFTNKEVICSPDLDFCIDMSRVIAYSITSQRVN